MIVPEPHWWFYDVNPMAGSDWHGSVGAEVEREPDEEPRKPIGFRFEKAEPEPEDPSWMLI